ncbi:hypothetical protein B7R54_14530 [Subtercola boreus]|uniref:carbonic anhydrase n=1 Tax=Subtercola boreus TaxID=120213 RepID=A0A3E0VKW3_9MICO|nr:carbonic anhydrase [Subtercola boreus]RFA10289.1 hypothetical protein B7R54_14530 [Subtercola boreus]TQL52526.1 carbonic anhydrase [Subtercola boreus]
MPSVDPYLLSNKRFAASDTFTDLSIYPAENICVITCLDPRTDPAAFFEISLGDAVVIRNAGGRVTPAVLADLALISYLSETKLRPDASPLFEIVVIHHNKCGTSFLAEREFRSKFSERAGLHEEDLIDEAVVDPRQTVKADVDTLLRSEQLSRRISVSGHVYDVDTGLVTTIVPTVRMPSHPGPDDALTL